MDFEHSERAQQYIAQVERFVRERIVPKEQTYVDQLVHTWTYPGFVDGYGLGLSPRS